MKKLFGTILVLSMLALLGIAGGIENDLIRPAQALGYILPTILLAALSVKVLNREEN